MNYIFTVYTNSQITRIVERPEFDILALALKPGEMYVDAYLPPEDYYVVASNIVPRPIFSVGVDKTSIFANEVDTAIFVGIPVGTEVQVDDQTLIVNDGEFVFTTDTAGEYAVAFTLFPYKDLTINVTAIDPA